MPERHSSRRTILLCQNMALHKSFKDRLEAEAPEVTELAN